MALAAPTGNVTFRSATVADVPRMAELIAGAHLPPLFIEEYLDGFVVVERESVVVACGGVEMYGNCGVVRSVLVDETARGLGLGGQIAGRLISNARRDGARDLYLFTAGALPFWQHYGFVEVTFDDWNEPARACWQYQFLSQNRDMVPDIVTMWRRA
jgi:N-acetylglutamate synthase-like GNAT family acetyltransferase